MLPGLCESIFNLTRVTRAALGLVPLPHRPPGTPEALFINCEYREPLPESREELLASCRRDTETILNLLAARADKPELVGVCVRISTYDEDWPRLQLLRTSLFFSDDQREESSHDDSIQALLTRKRS
jgi:hypothetical protein